VLWATHLIDEAKPGDDVAVLHRGRILSHGPLDAIVARTGASDIADAFAKLLRDDEAREQWVAS
jgi:ABC-2 type transport system ATP-binding protein